MPTALPPISGYPYSLAQNVNSSGESVGVSYSSENYGSPLGEATLWDAGSPVGLGSIDGLPYSQAINLNDSGVVIANGYNSDQSTEVAFVHINGTNYEIDHCVPAYPNLVIDSVSGINSTGQIVGAASLDGTGGEVPILLTPSGNSQFGINSFAPTFGPVGTIVTVTGAGFTGTTAASVDGYPASFTVVSNSEEKVTIPAAASTGAIHIKTSAGLAVSPSDFTVILPPQITSFSPTSGPTGTTVYVTGSGFTYTTATSVDGVPAAFTVLDDSDIEITVPTGASTGTIHIKTPAGLAVSTTNFTVLSAPTITSFTPASGPVGTVIVVSGTGFTGTTAASVDGIPASFTFVSDTTEDVTVPSGASTGAVHIKTPEGLAVSATNFTVTGLSSITSFTPTSGPVGTVIAVTGTGFTGSTAASVDSVPASFTVVSNTKVDVTVPSGASTGPIHIKTPAGLAVSPTNFTVIPAPTITSFTPTSGPVGTVIVVSGTGFTGTTAASVDGFPASFTVVSNTTEDVTVPAAASTGAIHIKTAAGLAISTTNFTVVPAPTITSFTPTSGPVGTVIVVTGTAFTGTTAASVDSVQASFTVVSNTTIDVTVPSGAATGAIHVKTQAGLAVSPTSFTVN